MIWSFPHQINLTDARSSNRLHQYPSLRQAKAQEDETILDNDFSGHGLVRFVHPDPAETDRVSIDYFNLFRSPFRRIFTMAPSMTTPAVTLFPQRHQQLARQRHDGHLRETAAIAQSDPLLGFPGAAPIAADCAATARRVG